MQESQRSKESKSSNELWAEFRFGVVGGLLSSPPLRGELRETLKGLAARSWQHPLSGKPTKYGIATIERWYYRVKRERGSVVNALSRKVRADRGSTPRITETIKCLLREQYREHPSWSYKLHVDNIGAEIKMRKLSDSVASSSAIRRWMQSVGLFKIKIRRGGSRAVALAACEHQGTTEVRSFENQYVGGLWHLDFHFCRRQVLLTNGKRCIPVCVAVLDDYSRIAAHVQWYFSENTENLVHAFSQALQKRGLPRELLSDNGSPMMSAEFTAGLLSLGILHSTTLPYSPYQNGKQERFFGVLEGRCMAMLENYAELSLAILNEATCAWVELEYQRTRHAEIDCTPLERFLAGKNVIRNSPASEELRAAFRRETTRLLRRSDGTLSLAGKRFEVPGRYRHLRELRLRYAEWDLSSVHLLDLQGTILCPLYPLDKAANSAGIRRKIIPSTATAPSAPTAGGIAPLLKELMARYAATGSPPAYLPKDEIFKDEKEKS